MALLLAAGHAGDELSEGARRERISRLRSRAAIWYGSRKKVIVTCPRCKGTGTEIAKSRNRGGLETGEVVTCTDCDGRCEVVNDDHYRKVFFDMMTPQYRAQPGRAEWIDRELANVREGRGWPTTVERWQIDRVELLDATHGVVWARVNGEKTPSPMRWIWTDENGKPQWFAYDEGSDGLWPGGEATGGVEEIDWKEWYRRAEALRAKCTTSLARLEALKAAAEKVVVVETVKIIDIEPAGDGAKIICCRPWGGPWRTSVEVGSDRIDQVRDWGKWDRLTWRARVIVNGVTDADVSCEILWYGPESIEWVKNPGLGGYEFDAAEPGSFFEWCAKFDAADAAGREEMIKEVRGKTLTDEATVFERNGEQVSVRFKDGTVASFPLTDPQAAEEVRPGDTIVVARMPDTQTLDDAHGSRENIRFRFGVLERRPAPADPD